MSDADRVNSFLQGIRDLVAEYPRLSIPVGAIATLLVAATIIRTLIDGFQWSTDRWGMTGAAVVVAAIVLISIASNYAVKHLNKPRPVLDPLPRQLLSKHPVVRWNYAAENESDTAYKVIVTSLDTEGEPLGAAKPKTLKVPKRVRYRELSDTNGLVAIKVVPVLATNDLKASRPLRAEIYEDSVARIQATRELRVGVHADAGENVFCYTDDDNWRGFDIQLARQFGAFLQDDLNLEAPISLEPVFYPWPEVIGSPNSYEVDMSIASITISPEREASENIIFSAPYATSSLGVVANIRGMEHLVDRPIKLEDMCGKTVAVHVGTTAESFVNLVREMPAYQDIRFHVAESNSELQTLHNYAFDFVIYDHKRCYSLVEPGMFVQALEHSIDVPPDEYGVTFCRANRRLRDRMNHFIAANQVELNRMLDERLEMILAQKIASA